MKATLTADPMTDPLIQRALEIIMKAPFEPWSVLGQEFVTMLIAYTIFLAYGKLLGTICRSFIKAVKRLFGFNQEAKAA